MIVRMNKYTFVVLQSQREDFLKSLQRLGLVDITAAGWEPGEEDCELMSEIDRHREATEYLSSLLQTEGFEPGTPYGTGAEAFEKYLAARKEVAEIEADMAMYEKMASEMRHWGVCDPGSLRKLAERGVVTHFFTAYDGEFAKKREEWGGGDRIVEEINTEKGVTYFVVLAGPDDEVRIDAQEIKLPAEDLPAIMARIRKLAAKRRSWDKVFANAAATLPEIEADRERLTDRLRFKQAAEAGREAAEGSLVVMEGWARKSQEKEVDRMLESYPAVVYVKERPTMDDETPVELKNSRITSPFEFIGEMYALPRYGTMDLTRYFAPFYMVFFGFCLADSGYGLLIFLGGLFLTLKGKAAIKPLGKLSMYCGAAAVAFGFFSGAFFGIDIKEWAVFSGIRKMFFPEDERFLLVLALGLGVFQILFGMVLRIVTTTRAFGFRYALGTLGWLIVLLTAILMIVPGLAGVELPVPRQVFWAALGTGAFMMLFLNNPGKNPLVNFGGGLWNLYVDLTGFAGDALSYIRLFAIGLSGGVLAAAFNQLAIGMSPDIPVVGQLVTLIILLIGHGLNMFMATLSSIVHPLRLTFLEFYKNAGFEASTRAFSPLRHTASDRKNNE